MGDPAEVLRRELADYDGLEVAAACACLQLLPKNVSHGERLEALAVAGLDGPQTGAGVVGRDEIVRWVTEAPSLYSGHPWDPYEGPFAEPVSFVGGGYLMLTGGDPEAIFQLRMVLWAMLGRHVPLLATALNRASMNLVRGVLALSTHACAVAGVVRWGSAGSAASVVVPWAQDLERLRSAVTYSGAELEQIAGVPTDALAPIIHDLDRDGRPPPVAGGAPVEVRPLVRRDDRYVLVRPGALAVALRHALVCMALEDGGRSALVESLALTALENVGDAAKRMGWTVGQRISAQDAPLVSLVADFDVDKVANLVVLYEDLEGYDPEDPHASWPVTNWANALERHLRTIEHQLMLGPGGRPNEILHVVVLAGCGRPTVFGLSAPVEPLRAPHLLLTVENLDQISMTVQDPLRLWKYARASDRLRDECQVMAFGALNEFAAWNERQSYYLSDDRRPTLIVFDGSHGRAFREKIARERDVHSVVSPTNAWLEVVRIETSEEIPIYGVLRELSGRPLLLVEGAPIALWVTAPGRYAKPAHRRPHAQMVQCLAYWLWQLTPSLAPFFATANVTRLVIEVALEDPEAWLGGEAPTGGGEVATAETLSAGVVQLTVHPSVLDLLNRADNTGERRLVRVMLEGMNDIAHGGPLLGHDELDAAIDRHMPVGPKKIISMLSYGADPALIGGDLPPYRDISPADTDGLLDEAGEHVARSHAPGVGLIELDARVELLNEIVAFHFAQLEAEVARLSPVGLLEHLVATHEAGVHHDATERLTLGARMAAYGETQLVDDLRQSIPDATQTAIALRFLIEYVTAQPPQGLRPISLDVYDRLLAICGQIISRGLTSDIIYFGLEDTELSMLESGRLGLPDTGQYHTGQQAFLDIFVPAHAHALAARYADAWETSENAPVPDEVAELNTAAEAEWGVSLQDLLEFFADLGAAASHRASAVATASRADLEAELAHSLQWPVERVRSVIDQITLEPRGQYLAAPTGFANYDVWPWRFNRGLSYLRRPLLVRSDSEFVWGVRHPHKAARYLFDLIMTERLQARSREMKRLMTRLRQLESDEFVDQVAALFRTDGNPVDTNVRKVAGEKIRRANKEDLGDIDVLSASNELRVIYALECKVLAGARTPAELANEIASIFRSGQNHSAADRHVERVAWLGHRIPLVLRHLDLEEAQSGWRVEGAIITDYPVMASRIALCPLPVYSYGELRERLTEPREA